MSTNITSQFYSMYPHSNNTDVSNTVQEGYFDQHLVQYGGIGFMGSDRLDSLYNKNGVFCWDSVTLRKLENVNLPGCHTVKEKQLVIIGYYIELIYDLMISVCDNVLQSPRFEGCIGVFGG